MVIVLYVESRESLFSLPGHEKEKFKIGNQVFKPPVRHTTKISTDKGLISFSTFDMF